MTLSCSHGGVFLFEYDDDKIIDTDPLGTVEAASVAMTGMSGRRRLACATAWAETTTSPGSTERSLDKKTSCAMLSSENKVIGGVSGFSRDA